MPLLSLSTTQLILACVASSILYRLTLNRFFLKWLASHRFSCYKTPTNQELRDLIERNNNASNRRNRHNNKPRNRNTVNFNNDLKKDEVFKIPSTELRSLKLNTTLITVQDFELLNYSVDVEWAFDLALMSAFSMILTRVQFYFYSREGDCNLSTLWALLVILYCFKILSKLTALYFVNEQSIGERSICIVSGGFFLLVAMVVLSIDENWLEFGLTDTYRSFDPSIDFGNNSSSKLAASDAKLGPKPFQHVVMKFSIAILCSLTAILFTFPGFRFGQLHKALIEHPGASSPMRAAYTINYLAPLMISFLWFKPIARDFVTQQESLQISDELFDILRIALTIVVCLLRFALLPKYIAVFLGSAPQRVDRIRFKGGTITNKEIQMTVSSLRNYVNVVIIQYILPVFMSAFTAVILETLGGKTSFPVATPHSDGEIGQQNLTIDSNLSISEPASLDAAPRTSGLLDIFPTNSPVGLELFTRMFAANIYRGIVGFATWWLNFALFLTSTIGLVYHTYFIY